MNLTPVIEGVVVLWSERICNRIKARWSTLGIQGNAKADWFLLGSVKGMVASRIIGSGQKAWIAEFGSGSLVDTDNPYLQEYLQSPQFNQWRLQSSRMPIMGRSTGEHKNIDGEALVSSDKLAEFDLERDGNLQWQPHEPMHIMQEEVTAALPEIAESLSDAISKAITEEVSLMLTAKIYI
ncbi:hypothetical protein [Sporomusa aerivorans]|uniref:hypothetical protein n=1 Tax=Sporomusa aerivorans TaxID=204936 RepID=UPI00352AB62E